MNPWSSLRGRGAFDALFANGKRQGATQLRCLYHLTSTPQGELHVGFSVPRRLGHAVQRNRVRRVMREAFRPLAGELSERLVVRSQSIVLVFVFRDPRGYPVWKVGVDAVNKEMALLLRQIVLAGEGNAQ